MTVINTLKPGLDEKIYENALVIELQKLGCKVDQQRQFAVRYDGQIVGTLVPDLIVNDTLIVDAKVVEDFNQHHIAQMLGYLSITGFDLALLINFKYARLAWKRVVKQEPFVGEIEL